MSMTRSLGNRRILTSVVGTISSMLEPNLELTIRAIERDDVRRKRCWRGKIATESLNPVRHRYGGSADRGADFYEVVGELESFGLNEPVQLARLRAANQALRSLRRSSSEVPPQIPDSWFVARANSRQGSSASQAKQTLFAASICSIAGPVVPIGKKRSGSVFRQAATFRQSSASHSTERFHIKATAMPPPTTVSGASNYAVVIRFT